MTATENRVSVNTINILTAKIWFYSCTNLFSSALFAHSCELKSPDEHSANRIADGFNQYKALLFVTREEIILKKWWNLKNMTITLLIHWSRRLWSKTDHLGTVKTREIHQKNHWELIKPIRRLPKLYFTYRQYQRHVKSFNFIKKFHYC